MVAVKFVLRTGIGGVVCLTLAPALAQEAGGIQTTFGIEQSIELGRNPALSIPADGDRTTLATRLSYGLVTETRTQRLSFDAESTFRIEDVDGETESAFESPALTFGYTREGANSSLDLSASYVRRDIDTLPLLSDFVGDDGVLDLPDDFTDLVGTGERTSYAVAGSLVVGTSAPLQFQLDLGASGTQYEDASDPDLEDIESANVGLLTTLRISPVMTGTGALRYSRTEEDDATETRITTRNIDAGLIYEISPRATFGATIGIERTETEETIGDTETSGLTGGLDFGYDMPNGDLTLSFDASRDVAGDEILTFVIGRSLELPAGSLAATLGVTQPENDDVEMVGSLDWTRELPTSRLLFRLNRTVTVDTDADTRRRSQAAAYYTYVVNPASSLNLGASFVVSEESSAENRVERTDLTASYSYALTENWDLNSTIGYTIRDEDTVGRAESSLITLSLGREFKARR